MSELSEAARRLIAEEGPLDEPGADELEAKRVRLYGTLGIDPALVTAGPLPSKPLVVAPAAKVALAIVAATGLSFASVVGLRASTEEARPATPTPTVSVAPRAAVAAPPAAVTPRAAVPSAAVPTSQRPAAEVRPVPPAADASAARSRAEPDTLDEESLLIAAAEAQLRAGHASAALALYERHLATFPRGTLRAESNAGRIASLCKLGREAEGRAELERFASRHPRSPSLPRLRRACGVEEEP